MEEKLSAFLSYVDHHVMHHWGSLKAITGENWLSTLGHDILAILHFDAIMLVLTTLILSWIALSCRKSIGLIPKKAGILLELYVKFIRDEIVYPNFGGAHLGRRFVPFFCSIFLFITVANMLGLIPLFTTATGNVCVTAGISLIFFGFAIWSALRIAGIKGTLGSFIPSGLPGPLKPIMFVMEIISFCTRTFALAIRLFANMLGGHIVLYAMVSLTAIFGIAAAPSLAIAVCLYLFEVFVACLQAYVFTMLAAIFTGMMVHPEH